MFGRKKREDKVWKEMEQYGEMRYQQGKRHGAFDAEAAIRRMITGMEGEGRTPAEIVDAVYLAVGVMRSKARDAQK